MQPRAGARAEASKVTPETAAGSGTPRSCGQDATLTETQQTRHHLSTRARHKQTDTRTLDGLPIRGRVSRVDARALAFV